jgi:hypothetical protein
MQPTIAAGNRPNSPQTWVHTQATLNLAWHHVIPFTVLAEVWNVLVERCVATQLAESQMAVRQFLALCSRYMPDIDGIILRMRRDELGVAECNQLAAVATWPPWNVVEGPAGNIRADDPGDWYIDRFTQGLNGAEQVRMRAVETLYSAFIMFTAAAQPVSAPALRDLAGTMMAYRASLACDAPIPFRETMWERGVDGYWRKRR